MITPTASQWTPTFLIRFHPANLIHQSAIASKYTSYNFTLRSQKPGMVPPCSYHTVSWGTDVGRMLLVAGMTYGQWGMSQPVEPLTGSVASQNCIITRSIHAGPKGHAPTNGNCVAVSDGKQNNSSTSAKLNPQGSFAAEIVVASPEEPNTQWMHSVQPNIHCS